MSEVTGFHPQFLVDQQGHKISVLLSIEEYESLLEDLGDLAAVAERRDEAVSDHGDTVLRLKADGLL